MSKLDDVDAILAQIKQLTNGDLSEPERKRLSHELQAVKTRLQQGDYQRFSYTTNVFDVPNRTSDFFVELEFYCSLGKTWERILKQFPLDQLTTIADLCPGFAPKVELGLFYLQYTGEVVILDNDKQAMQQLQKFLELFNPQFNLKTKNVDLFTKFEGDYELVIGNHIIDDLILYHFSQKAGISLSQAYESEQTMISLWNSILADPDASASEVIPLISSICQRVVKPGGHICLSQYPSYMERMLGNLGASDFNRRVFLAVVDELLQQGFISDNQKLNAAFESFKGHFTAEDCAILQRPA